MAKVKANTFMIITIRDGEKTDFIGCFTLWQDIDMIGEAERYAREKGLKRVNRAYKIESKEPFESDFINWLKDKKLITEVDPDLFKTVKIGDYNNLYVE